jgi:hypothetical protein
VQVRHVLRVEGHDDEVDVLDGVGDRDRMRSSLIREIGEGRSRRPGSNGLARAADPGPREFAMDTVCPSRVSLRVSVPPISPVPMMPIFMSWFLSD